MNNTGSFYSLLSRYRLNIQIAVYYFLLSLTFCYTYYQKIGVNSDFYSIDSSSGIFAVLNFEAIKVMQYRIFIPFVFKIYSLLLPFNASAVYFAVQLSMCIAVVYVFYRLLNEFFESRKINLLIAPVILYPMVWNYIILNGQSFYVDFSNLLFIFIGYYFIIRRENIGLLVTAFIGSINHDSIGFLIPMYILFNYKKIFTRKVILVSFLLIAIIGGIKLTLSQVFIDSPSVSFRWNYNRNYEMIFFLPPLHTVRNVLFIFGGLHLIILSGIRNPVWKKISPGRIMINMTIIPYVIIIFFIHSTEEVRNYITAIPFVIIPFLICVSGLENSFLKLKKDTDK